MSDTKLYNLSDEELIKELQHPEYPSKIKGADLTRSICLMEEVAQGKDLTGAEMSPDAKREIIFGYHPDSRLLCVYGKNRIGLDGVLESKEEEIKHRELWCKYNPCKQEAVTKVESIGKATAYSLSGATMMSSISSCCSCLLMMIGLASMFRS